ncbi:hypothetical protein CKM354_000958600 [Cercospora kikuchii]|uniref:N-acetyltransferase domain-containing protein n=1 Tax=Cercospora kikuchii TaxID=84275 RepID=A0A9P3CTP3_9PEZI|nr:uncharacterized protein CKM354_000958600 [Cercospora kikuchii]GIZ46460.1 hypothetical protein CKM354_000958600 [Cercospora kikuchii]
MVYESNVKAQPGDGSWLLQGGDSQQQPKRRRNRRGGKKMKTFLARKDSVVGADGDDTPLEMTSPPAAVGASTCDASCDNGHAAATGGLLSKAPSHRLSAAKQHAKSPLQASLQPRRTTWLRTTLQEDKHPSKRDTIKTDQTLTSTMAIPPHLRRKAAESSPAADQMKANKRTSNDSKFPAKSPTPSEGILPKLQSLGVKVIEPSPSLNWSRCSIKNESTESSLPNPRSLTAARSTATMERGGAPTRGRRGGRGGRGGTNGGHSNDPRNSTARGSAAFCKSSDIPKGDPKRWETDWEGRNEAAQDKGRRVKSNSWDRKKSKQDNNSCTSSYQPSHDSGGWTIQNWNSDLPPAPLHWDSRSSFRKGQSSQQIQTWLDMMEGVAMRGISREPDLDDLSVVDGFTYTFGSPQDPVEGTKYVTMGDIVPHYWVRPHFFGGIPLSTFFQDNINSNAPPPVDNEDLVGAQPWWVRVVRGGSFLEPCKTHDHKGMSPDESALETMHRQSDFGSQFAADNKRRYELAKRGLTDEKVKRRAEREARNAAEKLAHGGLTPEHLRPVKHSGKGLFLRYAFSDDMEAVRDIYNYYVDFTASVPETKRVTVMQLRDQFDNIMHVSKLPYLVAYEKGQVVKGRKKKGYRYDEDPVQLPDTIVGFIRAQEYGTGTDSYRISVKLEVFVHKDHLMKGIAKCLMDKMLSLLDPDHNEQGGYLVHGDDLDAAKPNRRVKNVVVHFLYPSDKPQRHEQIRRWLVGTLKFKETGTLQQIGSKQSKAVTKTIFVRVTGNSVEDANTADVHR